MPAGLTPTAQLPETALSLGGQSLQQLAAAYLREYLHKFRLALAGLYDEALGWRQAPGTNSAGNLLLHLAGNLSVDGIGGRPFQRRRVEELTAQGAAGKQEVLDRLARVVEECAEVIMALGSGGLEARYRIQTYDTDVRAAPFEAVGSPSSTWRPRGQRFESYPRHAGVEIIL